MHNVANMMNIICVNQMKISETLERGNYIRSCTSDRARPRYHFHMSIIWSICPKFRSTTWDFLV